MNWDNVAISIEGTEVKGVSAIAYRPNPEKPLPRIRHSYTGSVDLSTEEMAKLREATKGAKQSFEMLIDGLVLNGVFGFKTFGAISLIRRNKAKRNRRTKQITLSRILVCHT